MKYTHINSSSLNLDHHYRVVFVSVDTGMMGQLIKMEVLKKLKTEFGPELYRDDNLVLSAIHTHQGPAGYMQYVMYSITSFGFVEDSFQVIIARNFTLATYYPLACVYVEVMTSHKNI